MSTAQPALPRIDAIIFDLTGTTIDMSGSQVYAIELTVNNYFRETVIDQAKIGIVRRLIGYNNEWDTTYVLVRLIEAEVPVEDWAIEALRLLPIDRETPLFKKLYDIFQTCYLGSELYERLEGGRPPFPYEPGLISMEKSFLRPALLAEVQRKGYKVGMATGCPRQEAIVSLTNLGLLGPEGFAERYIVGLEDTPKTKPEPDPLLEAKRRLKAKYPLYIGDNASDIEAARRAGMACLYVGGQTAGGDPDNSLMSQVLRSMQDVKAL